MVAHESFKVWRERVSRKERPTSKSRQDKATRKSQTDNVVYMAVSLCIVNLEFMIVDAVEPNETWLFNTVRQSNLHVGRAM